MRTFWAGVALVWTLLLGVIAYELWPMARVARDVIAGPTATTETRDQRVTRLRREQKATDEYLQDFMAAHPATPASPQQPHSPAPPTARRPSGNTP